MAFTKVCTLDDVWQGEMEAFEVDGTEVLLVHTLDGEVHAVQAICPHQEVELAEGELEGKVLTCCMHLWQFDVSSGKGLNPTHAELAKFPVKVEGDDVLVDVAGIEAKFAHA
ncbi:MAG: Rieske 2Fe-2S domain-containing protein [Rhodospirillaceae bacterium]|jgi:toluene monooxygenase system ferredoxin subunit|nr:Rieske 2Fe-2S domain-containing protein [Rhodospirillaceae bacterium]MBT3925815.1 Rieske 2Fe-2S domain-containing protein [Rhodospirillaceae bacterium]